MDALLYIIWLIVGVIWVLPWSTAFWLRGSWFVPALLFGGWLTSFWQIAELVQ